jgi:hypothetical protein
MSNHPFILRSILSLSFFAALTPLSAQLELVSRTTVTPSDNWFGDSVALSPSYVVVGEPRSDEVAANAGTVSVFSAKSGAYQRLLKASDGASLDRFGGAVAVSGNRILVGASSSNGNVGAAMCLMR